MKLANKVAIITGAGSGMGKSAALLFATEGAKVAAVDIVEARSRKRSPKSPRRAVTPSRSAPTFSKSEDVKRMIDDTVAKYGGLNIVYNNAGIEGESNFMSNMTEEQFDRVIAINLRGVFLGMKYTLPHMMKARGGSIINTGVDRRAGRGQGRRRVFGGQGRRDRADPRGGARIWPLQHPCQRDLSGRDRNPDGGSEFGRARRRIRRRSSAFRCWSGWRNRTKSPRSRCSSPATTPRSRPAPRS